MKLKMIKKLSILVLLLAIILINPIAVVYGANINVELISDTQEYNIDETDEPIIVKIKLGDFVSIQEGITLAYSGTIEYDKNIFNKVEVTGKNEWNATYNDSNNMILGDTINATSNKEVAELKFYVNKENATTNQNTAIKLNDIIISDGNFEINANKQIEIKILSSKRKFRHKYSRCTTNKKHFCNIK